MTDVNVAILGLGRLGASFGLALKRYMTGKDAAHRFTITGYDERAYNAKTAKARGAVDATVNAPHAAAARAHIVLITAPYRQVETLYRAIGPDLAPGAVVLDASPLKKPSARWAGETLPQQAEVAAYLVGITPVLNPDALLVSAPDLEDPDHARADLFDRGALMIVPAAGCPAEAVELAAEFARIVGATAHFMDPDEHDALIAATEGLPALLGLALFRALSTAGAWGDLRRLSNPAFGLATHHLRHFQSGDLWALLHHNRTHTARYLDTLIKTLETLRAALEKDTEGVELEAALDQAAAKYEEWEKQRFTNQWEKEPEVNVPVTGIFGSLTGGLIGRRKK